MKDCKNADCGKCDGCLEEKDDPIGCKSVESIEFESIICFLFILIIICIIL